MPLGEVMEINCVYEGGNLVINGHEIKVDLIPLKLHDFDLIL